MAAIKTQVTETDATRSSLDIATSALWMLTSIFFICAFELVRPRSTRIVDSNADVFLLLGSLLFLIIHLIQVYQQKEKEIQERITGYVAVFSGIFWVIASFIAVSDGGSFKTWLGFWVTGAFFNCLLITYALFMAYKTTGPKSLFIVISFFFAWLANLLFFIGAIKLNNVFNNVFSAYSNYTESVDVLIAGAVMYLLHSICHVLSVFKPEYTIEF